MTITTDEGWDVDGTPLQTLMWNIRTWGGSLRGTPPLRGEDVTIPGRPGRVWVPKVPDSRTLVFEGWVLGADVDGRAGDTTLFRKNWRALRGLFFGAPDRQIALTQRFRDEDGVLVEAVGHGQVLDPLLPENTGPTRAKYSAAVFMADPFFYGEQVSIPIDAAEARLYGEGPYGDGPYGGSPIVVNQMVVPGDAASTSIVLRFTGPLTQARVVAGDQWVEVSTLAAGWTLDFDVQEYRATLTAPGGATSNGLGRLTHGPGAPWLTLGIGEQDVLLVLPDDTQTGAAEFLYRPAYL